MPACTGGAFFLCDDCVASRDGTKIASGSGDNTILLTLDLSLIARALFSQAPGARFG